MGHQEPHGSPVLGGEWLPVMSEREQVLGPVDVRQRQVGGEPLLRVDQDEAGLGPDARPSQKVLDRHSTEDIVVATPPGHAVDVARRVSPRE